MTRGALNRSRSTCDDEFYTLYDDIAKEIPHYLTELKGRTIYCNCDNPESNFIKYLRDEREKIGYKELIATGYKLPKGNIIRIDSDGNETRGQLEGNGDFASKECMGLLGQSDVIISNCPFSLFREYMTTMLNHGKKVLIVGNLNAISYKDIFPYLERNELRLGVERIKKFARPDGTTVRLDNVRWYTNMQSDKGYGPLQLTKHYLPEEYLTYDNYNAINVDRVCDIPCDYYGMMGVPTTYMDWHDPKQFKIMGLDGKSGYGLKSHKKYIGWKEILPDGRTRRNGARANGDPAIRGRIPGKSYYTDGFEQVYILYARIFIQRVGT